MVTVAQRARIGTSMSGNATTLLNIIEEAEASGVEQLWMTQNPSSADSLTVFAAAMSRTDHVRFGTSIVPTYPRHPLALAQHRHGVGPRCRSTTPCQLWPPALLCRDVRGCRLSNPCGRHGQRRTSG